MTTPIGYRGVVVTDPGVLADLADLAERFPLGARVQHMQHGRHGTIAPDHADRVPGAFPGGPSAHCLSSAGLTVCVAWDNDMRVRWLVWHPAHFLLVQSSTDRSNRPSLRRGPR